MIHLCTLGQFPVPLRRGPIFGGACNTIGRIVDITRSFYMAMKSEIRRIKLKTLLSTVMILSFRTAGPGQTVQTQIRLLLEEDYDQGLHCLPFRLHHLDYVRVT